MKSTTPGKKISLWSTSFLARKLSWVDFVKNYLLNTTCLVVTLDLLLPLSFCQSLVTEMEHRIRMGPIEFISSLGGLFGLCLGFSFISFFEIIYWATIALSRCMLECLNIIWFLTFLVDQEQLEEHGQEAK